MPPAQFVSDPAASGPPTRHAARPGAAGRLPVAVLHVPAFRRLWTALLLSSFGDWLGLLAMTALAADLSGGSYSRTSLAVAGVFILRLAPAIVLGPLAGAVADRWDRRTTMVVSDTVRFVLIATIPFVGTLWWLYVATVLVECAALFWTPAKEASVPNLVERDQLEQANQVSLLATYGSAPVAAGVFTLLTVAGGPLARVGVNAVDLAILFDALTFLVAAVVVFGLRDIPTPENRTAVERPNVWRTIVAGWRFLVVTPVVRGLVVGMLGAFAAGGAVVGLARTYVQNLGAGDPGYGVLFAAVFLGLAGGIGLGPRLVSGFSRRRLFGLSIAVAGLALLVLGIVPDIVLATAVTLLLGLTAGVAWVSGYTLLGLEVADEMRGRTFAFVQSMVRIVLVLVLAVAPLLAAAIGQHSLLVGDRSVTVTGASVVFAVSGALALALGVASYHQMDDRRGHSLLDDLLRVAGRRPADHAGELPEPRSGAQLRAGTFLALEGGEGAGKSSLAAALADRLREAGHEVVVTREPGGTTAGARLREMLLDPSAAGLSERTEALLYAADRAEHVARVVGPALERGAVVITDRFVDSTLAYQGGGRELDRAELEQLSGWATGGLRPTLTVLLDVPPDVGLGRVAVAADRAGPDRLEAEPARFHQRVRDTFLELAERRPEGYVVVDAAQPADAVLTTVLSAVQGVLADGAAREAGGGRLGADAADGGGTATRVTGQPASPDPGLADVAREREERRRRAEAARRVAAQERRDRLIAARARRVSRERARQAGRRSRLAADEAQRRQGEETARELAEQEARRRAAQEAERAAREAERRAGEEERRRAAEAEARLRAAERAQREEEEARRRAAQAARLAEEARQAEAVARAWAASAEDTGRSGGQEAGAGSGGPDEEGDRRRRASRRRDRPAGGGPRQAGDVDLTPRGRRGRRRAESDAGERSLTDELFRIAGADDESGEARGRDEG